MKKILILPFLLCLVACTPVEQQARNTAAALQGALTAAQGQYLSTCKANPTQQACTIINQAVSGENALITATEAYCGWTAGTLLKPLPGSPVPPLNPNCVPVKSAQAALQTAIANGNLFVTQLKGVIK